MLQARHILTERLGNALNLPPNEVEKFKYICTAASYFRLPDHEGGLVMPGTKHYRRGKEYTFDDVPWKAILDSAESEIERRADTSERTRIFREVMRGLPRCKSNPRWDKLPANPNEKPTTSYSSYRVPFNARFPPELYEFADDVQTKEGEEAPSNAQMLESFGKAAGLDERQLNFVSAQITWWDAMGDDDRSPMLGPKRKSGNSSGTNRNSTTSASREESRWVVTGGRLGRDHTFADVPSHYARDRLVHYTPTQLGSDNKERVLAALCPDLDQSDIAAHSKCIAEDQVEAEKDEANEERVSGKRGKNRGHKRASEGSEHGKKAKRVKALKSRA